MKILSKIRIALWIMAGLLALLLLAPASAVYAQTDTPEPPPPAVEPVERPIVVIESTYMDKDSIAPGDSFRYFLSLKNVGRADAHNLIFTFQAGDFLPEETGGVIAVGTLGRGKTRDISQAFNASSALWGKLNGSVPVNLSYTNEEGLAFSESFNITIPVRGWSGAVAASATPTPTGTSQPRAQMVVSGYQTNVDPLQPGSVFRLSLDIRNVGSGPAGSVAMVIGGGGSGDSTNLDGTPVPGGVTGSGADTSIFAPLGSSNLQYLGDVPAGGTLKFEQDLIVNVSANPGAYALKLSLVYVDEKGRRLVDDQVITLLVYQIPQLEVNFYRDPGMISAMQPNSLPLQVVNLGRKATVLGNMTVTTDSGAELMNNTSLVGTLDAGGYFPLDVMLIPNTPGEVELKITINYTDDFNQQRRIEKMLPVTVVEGMPMEPDPGLGGVDPNAPGGMPGDPGSMGGEETFWQKVGRFFKGLLGLDSGVQQPVDPGMPVDPGVPSDPGLPVPSEGKPLG
jgi:hypothetical protein